MRKQGFTLLEVLIALAIIGITFAVLAATQVTTLRVTSDSRRASDATEFANRELESAANLVVRNFMQFYNDCGAGPCNVNVGSGRNAGQRSIEVAGADYLEAGLIRVTVSVTSPADVEFSRLVSCMDVQPPPTVAAPHPCPDAP